MSLKNFVVTTQRVKSKSDGLIQYVNYLDNEKAPSHKNTKIINFGSASDDFLKNTIINTVNFDNNNKKGGRKVESLAQSFNFILPPKVENPTVNQWKLIFKDLVLKAKNTLEIEGKTADFAKSCYVNIHDQKNPHLNLLIPRIYDDKRLHALDQKNLLIQLKKEFNRSVLQHCNIDFKAYKPDQQNVGKRRKKWQLEQEQSIKAKEELADQRLLLAQDKLDVAELIDHSQVVQERAETAQIKAQEATAKAKLAEADADRKISLMNEMKNILNNFKSSINDWIKSIKGNNEILEDIALNEVLTTIETAQNHESYDDATESVMFNTIEQAEEETKKPEISKNVKRRRTYKP